MGKYDDFLSDLKESGADEKLVSRLSSRWKRILDDADADEANVSRLESDVKTLRSTGGDVVQMKAELAELKNQLADAHKAAKDHKKAADAAQGFADRSKEKIAALEAEVAKAATDAKTAALALAQRGHRDAFAEKAGLTGHIADQVYKLSDLSALGWDGEKGEFDAASLEKGVAALRENEKFAHFFTPPAPPKPGNGGPPKPPPMGQPPKSGDDSTNSAFKIPSREQLLAKAASAYNKPK